MKKNHLANRQPWGRLTPETAAPLSSLVSYRVWDLGIAPFLSSWKSALAPSRIASRRRRRKISIEVHRIDGSASGHKGTYEECIVRVLVPIQKSHHASATIHSRVQHASQDRHVEYHPNDQHNGDDEDEDFTVTPINSKDRTTTNFESPDFRGWEEKYRTPVRNVIIKGSHRSSVALQVLKINYLLMFDRVEQAEDFRIELTDQIEREDDRSRQKLHILLNGKSQSSNEEITFLIEISSAWDLPAGNLRSDPYVVCFFSGREIHRTQHIPNT